MLRSVRYGPAFAFALAFGAALAAGPVLAGPQAPRNAAPLPRLPERQARMPARVPLPASTPGKKPEAPGSLPESNPLKRRHMAMPVIPPGVYAY